MDLNLDALEQGGGAPVIFTGEITGATTGGASAGWSEVAGATVSAAVFIRKATGLPDLSLIVEQSDDGDSWETVDTITYTDVRQGQQHPRFLEIDAPKDLLRVRATVTGSLIARVTVAGRPYVFDRPAAPGGSHPVEVARVPVSAATLKASQIYPLVAAQGANTIVVPLFCVCQYIPGGTPYDSNATFRIGTDDGTGTDQYDFYWYFTGVELDTLNAGMNFADKITGHFNDENFPGNQPLTARATSQPTTGDGSVVFTVPYYVTTMS